MAFHHLDSGEFMFTDEEIVPGAEVTFRPSLEQAKQFALFMDTWGHLSGIVGYPILHAPGWMLNIAGKNTLVMREAVTIVSGLKDRPHMRVRAAAHLRSTKDALGVSDQQSSRVDGQTAIEENVAACRDCATPFRSTEEQELR